MTDTLRIPFQDLRQTDPVLIRALEEAAVGVIRSGRYINGENVSLFEQELAAASHTEHAVATSTGLDALRLILRAYIAIGRLRPGDEVVIPANTFIATFLAVTDAGLRPVAAEPDPITFGLDFRKLPVTSRTRAVIPVHLYGTPCWDAQACDTLHQKDILIIEDNAQAIGAEAHCPGLHDSRTTGSLGDAAAVSFYPAKNIGALGDAGAVTTSDPVLAKTIRELANYGGLEKYSHRICGYNCRMDEIQAAMLRVKLPLLQQINNQRRHTASSYDTLINNPRVLKPAILTDRIQVWHQYVVRCEHRDQLRQYLQSQGIGTEIHYALPAHLQPCYRESMSAIHLPTAEQMAKTILSLPRACVSDDEAAAVAHAINEFK